MFKIGCHLSSSKGYLEMGKNALEIRANTFQFFTRNPRGGRAKAIDLNDIKAYQELSKKHGFAIILAHAPYTLNACSAKDSVREFAYEILVDDLKRMEYTPYNMYNFHPGSHVGQGTQRGIELIADMINRVLKPEHTTKVLLETMSGKGSEVGRTFEELRDIIDRVELNEKLGVCLDTCHIYDSGYDIVNELDKVIDEFDNIIGLNRLYAIHLNDSKNPFASHNDRHETIGDGSLGIKTIANVINHPRLHHLPFFLETPNDLGGYAKEIELLKSLRRKNLQ